MSTTGETMEIEATQLDRIESAGAASEAIFHRIAQLLQEERRLSSRAVELLEQALTHMREHAKLLGFLPVLEETLTKLKASAEQLAAVTKEA